jgi:TPR repeat protein
MMKRILTALFLSISLLTLIGVSASAQDLQKGAAAWGKGDYATALKELRPLAARGVSTAQFILGSMYDNGKGVAQDYAVAAK